MFIIELLRTYTANIVIILIVIVRVLTIITVRFQELNIKDGEWQGVNVIINLLYLPIVII